MNDDLLERAREDANPLGPARGVLIGLAVGVLLWTIGLLAAWEAIKGLG